MVKLKNLSKNYINFFFNKVKVETSHYYLNLYEYFEKFYCNCIIPYKLSESNQLITLKENKFMSNEIKNLIYNLTHCHKITFTLNKQKITILIYHKNDINIEIFSEIITKYICFMYKLSNFKKSLSITYYLTDSKKKIKHKILTVNEVNTGSASIKNIIIWRKEEVYKTTLHELIHFMNLDKLKIDNSAKQYYEKKYNKNLEIFNLRESYTDFWAVLINLYLTTRLLKKSYNYFKYLLTIEKMYIIYQAKKVLQLNKNMNKNTDVFNYYVIKAELFQNLPKTLKLLDTNIKNGSKLYKNIYKFDKINIDEPIRDNSLRMTMIELI